MRTSPHRAPKSPDSSNTPPPPWSFPCLPPDSPPAPRVPPSSEPPAGSESKKRCPPLPIASPRPAAETSQPSRPLERLVCAGRRISPAPRRSLYLRPPCIPRNQPPRQTLTPNRLALPGSRTPRPAASPLMPGDLLPRYSLTPNRFALPGSRPPALGSLSTHAGRPVA